MAHSRADKKHVIIGCFMALVGALAIVGLARNGMFVGHLQGFDGLKYTITFGLVVWRQCDNTYPEGCAKVSSYDDKIAEWAGQSHSGDYSYRTAHQTWADRGRVVKAAGAVCMLLFLLQASASLVDVVVSFRLAFLGACHGGKAARALVHLRRAQLGSTICALTSGVLVLAVWSAMFPYADVDHSLWMVVRRYPYGYWSIQNSAADYGPWSSTLTIDVGIIVQIPALLLSVAALVVYAKMSPRAAIDDQPTRVQDVPMVSAGFPHGYPPIQLQQQSQMVSWPGPGGDLAGPTNFPYPYETGAEQAALSNPAVTQPAPAVAIPGAFNFCPQCGRKRLPAMSYCYHCGIRLA
eukprot:TRINITY_DN3718_c0_g1_i1.p1 TRINITY_DN3718_c0_g1~~TRINITY_DN3718_c0_g1_i1.p1  ORF type:complete len:350 (-),score=29.12 TRINITY_DN3718_c0_g1_i1:156-1205(-)